MAKKQSPGLFDEQNLRESLNKPSFILVKLKKSIPWDSFRTMIENAVRKPDQGQGGRPAFDSILMFKILILQRIYNLSDEKMEFEILDRTTFKVFLDLELEDTVPDQKTIWLFREQITQSGIADKLFNKFAGILSSEGMIVKEGVLVDATLIEVPKQRNTKKENDQLKEGKIPAPWKKNPNMLSQKDTDARWVTKGGKAFYGYKNNVKVCKKTKLILNFEVDSANVHDNQFIEKLVNTNDKGQCLYADGGYDGMAIREMLTRKGIIPMIKDAARKNKFLTPKQEKTNKRISKVRARVEHVFASIKQRTNGLVLRCIGLVRAKAMIAFQNLTYNMERYAFLVK